MRNQLYRCKYCKLKDLTAEELVNDMLTFHYDKIESGDVKTFECESGEYDEELAEKYGRKQRGNTQR